MEDEKLNEYLYRFNLYRKEIEHLGFELYFDNRAIVVRNGKKKEYLSSLNELMRYIAGVKMGIEYCKMRIEE